MRTARKNARAAEQPIEADTTDPWVSVPDAAELLGESKYRVLARAQRGELDTSVVAGRIFVHRASIERVLRSRDTAPAGAR